MLGREYDAAVWDLEDEIVGSDRIPNRSATGQTLVDAVIETAKRHGLREKDLVRAALKRWEALFSPGKQTDSFLEELRMLLAHPTKLLESSDHVVKVSIGQLRNLIKEWFAWG